LPRVAPRMMGITNKHRWMIDAQSDAITVIVAALFMLVAAAAARPFAVDHPIIVAQGGFTFGSRDDLGPRYDPYS
jgi:hypothetical protein